MVQPNWTGPSDAIVVQLIPQAILGREIREKKYGNYIVFTLRQL